MNVGMATLPSVLHLQAAASEDRAWSLWDVGSERVRTTWRGQSMFRGMAVSPDKVGLDRCVMMGQEGAVLDS